MKLQLKEVNGVYVLSVSEKITMESFRILKAGITKLFKDGRNKILVDLEKAEGVEHDAIHELAILNVTARELSGEIALGGLSPDLFTQIKHFAKPPVISHFRTNEEAFALFRKSSAPAAEETRSDSKELKTLREENARFKKEKEFLETQLRDMIIQRRSPPNEETYQEKIGLLEAKLAEFAEAQKAPASNQKGPDPKKS